MRRDQPRFWTAVVLLLMGGALLSACSLSSGSGTAPGPTPAVTPSATPALQPTATASSIVSSPPDPEITFPLALGNTWVFQLTRYEGASTTETVTTTLVVTETVVEIQNVASYLVAKIHREEGPEQPAGEVPPRWQGLPLKPASSSDVWLVVRGNRIYHQEGKLNLSDLRTALVEFVFPIQLGARWYRSDEKAQRNPTYADDWMLVKVTKVGSVVVPAGEFHNCFALEEVWAGFTAETWFCPHVGVVSKKADHHGTPYGLRQVLLRYSLNK